MKFELNVTKRTLQGSGASRRLRRADKVPGIVYGGKTAPVPIEIAHNDLWLALRKEAFHSSLLTLKVDGVAETVLLRDSQMHPYKSRVLHVDFQRVDAAEAIRQKVPLHFINAELAPGVKITDGIVSHAMNEVEVTCLPKDLPPFIEVDLQTMEIGHSLHVSQLTYPQGVTPVMRGVDDPVVVAITAKKTAPTGEEGEGAASSGDAATPAASS